MKFIADSMGIDHQRRNFQRTFDIISNSPAMVSKHRSVYECHVYQHDNRSLENCPIHPEATLMLAAHRLLRFLPNTWVEKPRIPSSSTPRRFQESSSATAWYGYEPNDWLRAVLCIHHLHRGRSGRGWMLKRRLKNKALQPLVYADTNFAGPLTEDDTKYTDWALKQWLDQREWIECARHFPAPENNDEVAKEFKAFLLNKHGAPNPLDSVMEIENVIEREQLKDDDFESLFNYLDHTHRRNDDIADLSLTHRALEAYSSINIVNAYLAQQRSSLVEDDGVELGIEEAAEEEDSDADEPDNEAVGATLLNMDLPEEEETDDEDYLPADLINESNPETESDEGSEIDESSESDEDLESERSDEEMADDDDADESGGSRWTFGLDAIMDAIPPKGSFEDVRQGCIWLNLDPDEVMEKDGIRPNRVHAPNFVLYYSQVVGMLETQSLAMAPN